MLSGWKTGGSPSIGMSFKTKLRVRNPKAAIPCLARHSLLENAREVKMNELLKLAIDAHGGLDQWNSLHTVAVNVSVGGALWSLKRQQGLFADARYEADTH